MMFLEDPLDLLPNTSIKSPEQKGLVGSRFIHLNAANSAGESKPLQYSKVSLSWDAKRCHLFDGFKYYAVFIIQFNDEKVSVLLSELFPYFFGDDYHL